jgi:hypothetical protein
MVPFPVEADNMTYPIISTDLARLDSVEGQRAVYIGGVCDHPEYAAWENQTVTLRDEGEVEAEARLVRQPIGGDDQWFGVLLSDIRDISIHEVFADFNRLEMHPDLGQVIPLGPVAKRSDLAREVGHSVRLVEWDNLQAQGRIVEHDGWWFGVLTSPIEELHPAVGVHVAVAPNAPSDANQ